MGKRIRAWDKTPEGKKYRQEYYKTNYDRISILVPKGTREVWKKSADSAGLSLSKFVSNAVEAKIASSDK